MLRYSLYKKFVNGGGVDPEVEKIQPKGITAPIPTMEEYLSNNQVFSNTGSYQDAFQIPNLSLTGFKTSDSPEGTVTDKQKSYKPGTFKDEGSLPTFTSMLSPLNPFDVNQKTPGVEQGPLSEEEATMRGIQTSPITSSPKEQPSFWQQNSSALATLGLLGVDSLAGYNEDLKNQRNFNESIQQRNSKPVYDYNFMYGRTTSGGTEDQPTIKAEMGAKINKRYASEGMNDVEIEGGEFIQLPNLDTEMAEGPSHSNGGIPTNLPDQTRVYSNNLKPEGSKKTFAQIAKNYDTTSYKKTLENPFAKQVDKDTASLMMKRNQKILDELFEDQQLMNGNSNGELEAKRGASINNPGFKALPGYVQAKITANMADGGKKNSQPDVTSLPPEIRNYAKWDPTFKKEDGTLGVYRLEVPSNLDFDAKTNIARAAESYGIKNLVQTSNQRIKGSPNVKGFYAGLSPQDFEQKIVRERIGKEEAGKLNELETRKKAFEILGVDPGSYNINDPAKLYNDDYFRESVFYPKFQNYLPKDQFRPVKGNDRSFGFEHLDAKPIPAEKPKDPETTETTPVKTTETKDIQFNQPGTAPRGTYTPGKFPLYQAIPEAMGLAQSQQIYPYAIPEIDAPYLRPQTLNIQSELQNIDNMGTAAMRSGADPLDVYIAGIDAKQKAFQTKQNYDAEGRTRADMANAQTSMQADQFNAQAFDRVYNNLVGQARDAQSAEKQASIANMITKKGLFDQSESRKAAFINNLVPSFNTTSKGQMDVTEEQLPFYFNAFNNYIDAEDTKKKTAKKGMYKKPKY